MAEIVRRRSWGGVLPLGRHVSISGSRSIHAPSVSIAPSSFQEEQNARHHKQFKLEQALDRVRPRSLRQRAVGSARAGRAAQTASWRCLEAAPGVILPTNMNEWAVYLANVGQLESD